MGIILTQAAWDRHVCLLPVAIDRTWDADASNTERHLVLFVFPGLNKPFENSQFPLISLELRGRALPAHSTGICMFNGFAYLWA